ncbi:hypothetical protein GCM10023093_13170 [Nemorincola caseinilytica]|uniref:Uncharacterized protein n=2 Tax=Nemorincola caseinilytica TaxID=2054315 RepID=A0ABP8ND55_9BACT
MRARTYLLIALCGLLPLADACTRNGQADVPAPEERVNKTTPQHTFSQKGSVRQMTIWPEEVAMPDGPGKTEFTSYCGICHSLRYVTEQPDFPRKTWEAEVQKMVEKYGAPIDSATCTKIVDYLMTVKGQK